MIRDERGFTLIEMLVVLVVLALIVVLVVGRGPARSAGLSARMAANSLAGVLRAARSEAIAADRPVTVVVGARAVQVGERSPQSVGALLAPPDRPIVFAPDGSSNGGQIGVGAGNVHKLVDVAWLTGRVSITDAP